MITLTNEDKISIEKDLSIALNKFSNGKLNNDQSKRIAKDADNNINFSNSALTHKGINWYAKRIIDVVDFDALNKY